MRENSVAGTAEPTFQFVKTKLAVARIAQRCASHCKWRLHAELAAAPHVHAIFAKRRPIVLSRHARRRRRARTRTCARKGACLRARRRVSVCLCVCACVRARETARARA
eukprot:5272081-Pleurochrysis_carterae.AAC.1